MRNLLYRWVKLSMLAVFFMRPYHSMSQEAMGISVHMYEPKDTAEVMAFIRKGRDIIYNHTDSALSLFLKAEQLSRRISFQDGVGYALAYIGLATTTLGNYEKGFAFYRAALPYCLQATQLKSALIHLYFNMALSWGDQEDYLKANEYYHKVIELLQERFPDDHQLPIAVYNNLVAIQVNMGSYTQALAYADQATQLARTYNKKSQLAQVILTKGDIYFSMQKYDSALSCYHIASEYVNEVQEDDLSRSYCLRMGDVLLEKGRYREALDYLQKAKRLSASARPLSLITTGYSLGDALYRLGRYKEAEHVLLEALAKAKKTGLTKNKQNGHAVLIELYKKQGRFEEALEQQSQYLQLSDSIINLDKIRSVNEIEIKYQVARKDKAIMQKELKIARQGKELYRQNITIAGVTGGIILLAISGFIFYRYKQKVNLHDRKMEQLKAMMDGEEKERVRLARELHDGLGGMLTGIKLSLRSIQRQPDPAAIKENLTEIMDMLKDMGEEIRLAAHNLMPDILVKHRLKEALQLYCEHLNAEGQLKIDLQFYGEFSKLELTLELQLYRIIQELLQNIIRHANASFAAIQVRNNGKVLCVSVEDNGSGFDPGKENTGMGLRNIEARVKAMGGYFSLASAAIGTTVYFEFYPGDKSMGT